MKTRLRKLKNLKGSDRKKFVKNKNMSIALVSKMRVGRWTRSKVESGIQTNRQETGSRQGSRHKGRQAVHNPAKAQVEDAVVHRDVEEEEEETEETGQQAIL